eukprot:Em0179g5a
MAEGRSNQELRAGEALCRVAQLDSKDTLDFKCERKIRVQELIDQVYKHLNLDEEEKEYFSLFYESQPHAAKGQEAQNDAKQEKVFLDPAKLAKDQVPNGKDTSFWNIKFGVKFYLSSPDTMLRSDSSSNYEEQIVDLHKAKMGYNPEQAESEFLELASKLPRYVPSKSISPHPTPEVVFDVGKTAGAWGCRTNLKEQQVVVNFHHTEQLAGDETSKYTIRCQNGSYKIEGAQPQPEDTGYSLPQLREDATTAHHNGFSAIDS